VKEETRFTFGLRKPGKALTGLLIGVTVLWVFFAAGINWGHAGEDILAYVVGSKRIFTHAELWRIFTSPLIHQWSGPGSVSHLLTTLAGLYFLGASLEEKWGARRFLLFTLGAGWFAAALQALFTILVPKLDGGALGGLFYGGLGMVDAIAVAWALGFKGQQVRLFFVLPVSGLGLLLFVFLMNVFYVIAQEGHHEGLVTPFAGMAAGYLFGDTSPLRRWYLQMRFRKLQRQSAALRNVRTEGAQPRLRVIEGGAQKSDKSMLN
jgi:membrane associated rhomboid family serine protease